MEYEIKPQKKLSIGLDEMIQFKELFYFFTWRDIKVKYKQTALGFVWAILQPFIMMVVFSLFFGKALNVPSDNIPYPVFVYSGLLIWNIFSSGLTNAGNSMVTNANIIKKIYFPRMIIPASSILVSFFDFLMALIIFIGLIIYYAVPINPLLFIALMFISLLITLIGTFGLGLMLAALNIKYRDFRYIIPFMVQALLFLTPVIYPVSIISQPWIKYILAVNPMYSAIEIFRYAIIDRPLDVNLIIISISSAVLLLLLGTRYFRKTESYFADLV